MIPRNTLEFILQEMNTLFEVNVNVIQIAIEETTQMRAVIKVSIRGKTNCSFPVHSRRITVRLIVIRAMPPRTAAAPMSA